jgi:hypothetical protein
MQTACAEKERKIIICENTAQHAEHKLMTVYFKAVQLKGKAHNIPIYYPLDLNDEELRASNKVPIHP